MKQNPKNILYCGTNDINDDSDPQNVEIVELAKSISDRNSNFTILWYCS